MNVQRAQDIADSPSMADVTYNGVPVYIQRVDQEKETARIYPLDEPDQEQEVALSSLSERSAMPIVMDIEQIACRLPNDT